MKRAVLLILFLVMVVLGSMGDDNYPMAPDFTVVDLDGKEFILSEHTGKVIFVNFWATWCPPCRAEIPNFIEVFDKYKDKGLLIIGISLDRGNPNKIKSFVEEYEINYPVAKGSMRLARDYGTGRVVPETFILDKKGRIMHKHIGYMDKEQAEQYFLELNGEK